MKNILLLTLCFFVVEIFGQDYVADEIYIKLKSVTLMKSCNSHNDMANLAEFRSSLSINTQQKNTIKQVKASFFFCNSSEIKKTFRAKVSVDADIDDLLNDLNKDTNVEYAERIPIMKKSFTPNDLGAFSYQGQWGLHKIRAKEAWDIGKGSPVIVVAVVDDAIDTDHEDLKNICLQGWDLADEDNDPRPISTCHSHGTRVAGVVGAETNNSKGIAAIGNGISILPVKVNSDSGSSCTKIDRAYEGVMWAADNGANIINMSWGAESYSDMAKDAIDYADSLGIILVAGAGNSGHTDLFYPAAFDNVIAIASTDIDDTKADSSNFGEWIDIAGPGVGMNTTFPFDGYGLRSGTSMATPMVAGLLGLVWSADITKDSKSIINCVLNTTDNIDAKNPDFAGLLGAGRINAFKSILCVSPFPVCEFNKRFTDPISNFLDQQVKVNIFGLGNNIILPGADVTYDAGGLVQLLPGFKALKGSRFHAFIDGCKVLSKTSPPRNVYTENGLALSIYPNPFKRAAIINYQLENEDQATITLFDAIGKRLTTLAKNQPHKAGKHQLQFNAANLPTGIYYLKLQSNETNIIKKLMIAK